MNNYSLLINQLLNSEASYNINTHDFTNKLLNLYHQDAISDKTFNQFIKLFIISSFEQQINIKYIRKLERFDKKIESNLNK